ncbi:hypothetical protein CG747_43870 [Streptomyces sp. CB02959]|uniref:hypothetical protein n=1 Tax=Streptomyces sp. CB02959 TaxID=2020330 RepID=UPI000C275590|nr:hypothetical protein [Streptomyces sp. CB02959]PJN32207.1 hypothetical protein CG747_43870 [Streptomyces sp. CB02959]
MRLPTTTVLSLSGFAALTLAGCSNSSTPADASAPSASVHAHQGSKNTTSPAPLTSATLSKRLLNDSDLGEGYTPKAPAPAQHDDVTVLGCPALEKLGGDAAAGGSLNFPRQAKASFAYAGGSDSEVSEELYSDTAQKLSQGIAKIYDALTSCPKYQVVSGSAPVEVTTQKVPTAQLGDERWSQLLTFTVGGRSSIVKQTAVRTGTIVVLVSGSPALVDAHVEKALDKARADR